MRTDTEHRHSPPVPLPQGDPPVAVEPVDLDVPAAVSRAIALHQAGRAVFRVPFGAVGPGTLTWLDPRARDLDPEEGEGHHAA